MKKLSKEDKKDLAAFVEELRTKDAAISAIIEKINGLIREELDEAMSAFNDQLADVKEFLESKANDMSTYFDERSEKWQEGDAGAAYTEWKDKFEEWGAEHDHLDLPDELEYDMAECIDSLTELPTEPGEG